MKFTPACQQGVLIKRYKRFLADIELADGSQITIHCPNTGSMKNCCQPGSKVWFSTSNQAKRKYPHTWEIVETPITHQDGKVDHYLAGINTGRANHLVREAIDKGVITELQGYSEINKEVRYGKENSRIDFLLKGEGLVDCYVEVKNVTLAIGDGWGIFPDAVTTRGAKHIRELMEMVEAGHRAVLLFCVQHHGIEKVAPADAIDSTYSDLLREAIKVGVEVIAYQADLSAEQIELVKPLPVYDCLRRNLDVDLSILMD
ncbi:DNA/RNA nuclease SfsA [Spartinivicinus poritis]|uniref:Sugar fermentation stimulation protein homolog n=1 Tax=Spartinivicinus poritis TaxID=2994640 RepID=A0ABT5U9X5_9GAMM|nr:DNA/RNA nuclease SfsA [Spartinivicinus sp. A2-2]MDE1463165.1 DNA/RNA nuclease SfsA [Spartinivicinus sp. A2-2]